MVLELILDLHAVVNMLKKLLKNKVRINWLYKLYCYILIRYSFWLEIDIWFIYIKYDLIIKLNEAYILVRSLFFFFNALCYFL